MSVFTIEIKESQIPFHRLVFSILSKNTRISWEEKISPVKVEQFCDDGEGELVQYNVYKITADICTQGISKEFVLKKSDDAEIHVYADLLDGHSFSVPEYYGCEEWNGHKWILIEFMEGCDLRDFTEDMAHACAESIAGIMNTYWQEVSGKDDIQNFERGQKEDLISEQNNVNEKNRLDETKKTDDRFERYWKRIHKRAKCLENEPLLKVAYQIFIQRQLHCPRTLGNGDFLQYNGIYKDGKVYLIDWAFGGIMPYTVDIARLIAHGTEDKVTFPFYMNDDLRSIYVREVYDKLVKKPDWNQYLFDIKLALLNEYIEFVEVCIEEADYVKEEDYYYVQACKLAKDIINDSNKEAYL